jgi:hypothetical protein
MMADYNLKKGKPFDNFMLAPKMFLKGRLSILPPKTIKGFKDWIRKLWKRGK